MYSFILMYSKKTYLCKICVFITLFNSLFSFAQGTLKDYKRSIAVDTLFKNKTYNTPTAFYWHVNNTPKGKEYIKVNALSSSQELAFDHERMAKSLSILTEGTITSGKIAITDLEFNT